MKSASVSETKNGLSALLDEVRRGETVLITHHGTPVARIERCDPADLAADAAAAALVQRGVADPPRDALDVDGYLAAPVPRLAQGLSASRIVAAERDEGR